MNLQDYTEQELVEEIERRKRVGTRPVPLENITKDYAEAYDAMQTLIALVEEAVDEAIERGYLEEDICHYVYETFIQLAYGDSFFKWSNKLG